MVKKKILNVQRNQKQPVAQEPLREAAEVVVVPRQQRGAWKDKSWISNLHSHRSVRVEAKVEEEVKPVVSESTESKDEESLWDDDDDFDDDEFLDGINQ